MEQAEMAEDEHWLYVLWQKRPVVLLQIVAPQVHVAPFAVVPLVFEQRGYVAAQRQVSVEEHFNAEVVRVLK